MDPLDQTDNLNDLIIEIKAQIAKSNPTKKLMIREFFVLWYALLEDVDCENFTDADLLRLLQDNYNIYTSRFSDDPDYQFIVGWAANISFWYLDLNETSGMDLIKQAYKKKTSNLLFKWAMSDQLKLSDYEVKIIARQVCDDFEKFYDYGRQIKEYFLRILQE